MAKSIILELAHNSTYLNSVHAENKPEYLKCMKEYEEITEKLCANLPKDEKYNILFALEDAKLGMEGICADEFFKAGFKLGLTIAAQNLLDD